jgi:hypothetical protein
MKHWIAKSFFQDYFVEEKSQVFTFEDAGQETITGIVKKVGFRNGDITSRDFEEVDITFTDIKNGYAKDCYIRQGVDKYVDQILKEGYDLYGKNPKAVEYVKTRLKFIAEATMIPTEQLITEIVEDVVKYSNSVIVKVRNSDSTMLPKGQRIQGINGSDPIVGYFPQNILTMSQSRDKNGTVLKWQQKQETGDKTIKFAPEDIVHFHYKKARGDAWGESFLVPVLDDVRALRKMEEQVMRMIYRNIFPYYHYKIGDKEASGSQAEIDEITNNLTNMDLEDGIITSNRVEVKPIASNTVINAEPYLKYLEERVFTGLGIPGILFGRGGSGTRSSSDSMTSELIDRITAIERSVHITFDNFIIKELLLEGGFDPILNEEDAVHFRFKTNDLDRRIKQDTHAVYMYQNNAWNEDEMRTELGKEPIADRSKMFQYLITIENAKKIAEAQAEATAKFGGMGTGAATGSSNTPKSAKQSKQELGGTSQTSTKQKPTNQFGTKTSPKKLTNSFSLGEELEELRKEVIDETDLLNIYKLINNSKESVINNGCNYSIVDIDKVYRTIEDDIYTAISNDNSDNEKKEIINSIFELVIDIYGKEHEDEV